MEIDVLRTIRFFGIAALIFVSACSGPQNIGLQPSKVSSASAWKTVLAKHSWHVLLKSGEERDSIGFAVIKRAANTTYLELRTPGSEQQINFSDIASISRGSARQTAGRHGTSLVMQ
jgi:hypothetical protein